MEIAKEEYEAILKTEYEYLSKLNYYLPFIQQFKSSEIVTLMEVVKDYDFIDATGSHKDEKEALLIKLNLLYILLMAEESKELNPIVFVGDGSDKSS